MVHGFNASGLDGALRLDITLGLFDGPLLHQMLRCSFCGFLNTVFSCEATCAKCSNVCESHIIEQCNVLLIVLVLAYLRTCDRILWIAKFSRLRKFPSAKIYNNIFFTLLIS